MHERKSVLGIGMARGELGELTRGELMRFHCKHKINQIHTTVHKTLSKSQTQMIIFETTIDPESLIATKMAKYGYRQLKMANDD